MVKLRNILIALSLALSIHAQNKVTIRDTLYNADGTKAQGNIAVSWPAFISADGFTIAKGTLTVLVVSGQVSTALVPTAGAIPAGTSYTAVYSLVNRVSYTEYWTIPTTGPVTIAQIRTMPVPVPTVTFGEQQLTLGAGMGALLGLWRRSSNPVATGEGQCYWDTTIHTLKCTDQNNAFHAISGGGENYLSSVGRTDITQVAPPSSSPTVALAGAGAGNVTNGAHNYAVTFVTAAGETTMDTTNTCLAQVTVADNTTNGKVGLTNIPTGPAGTTARRIYRTAVANVATNGYLSCGFQQLVATIADNTTATYTDNTADSGLGVFIGLNTTGPSIWSGGKRMVNFSAASGPLNGSSNQYPQPSLDLQIVNFMDPTNGIVAGQILPGSVYYGDPSSKGGIVINGQAADPNSSGVASINFYGLVLTDQAILYPAPAFNFNAYYSGSDSYANKLGAPILGVATDGAPGDGIEPWNFVVYNGENGSTFNAGWSAAGGFVGVNTTTAPSDSMMQVNGTVFPGRAILTVQGTKAGSFAGAQTADLQRWKNGVGTTLSAIDVNGNFTARSATATALAANGTNCSAGSYAAGVDASGNAEGCAALSPLAGSSSIVTVGTLSAGAVPWSLLTGVPSTFTPAAHNLLSSSHGDTTAASVARGDIITGQTASPLWKRLAIGTQYQVLQAGATEPLWGALNLAQSAAVTGILPTGNLPASIVYNNIANSITAPSSGNPPITVNAASTVPAPTFTGSGLNDASLTGNYFFTQPCGITIGNGCWGQASPVAYRFQVDGTGSPNTFKWSRDGGSSWAAAGVAMVANTYIDIEGGLQVKWTAATGHTLNDRWDSSVSASNPFTAKNANGDVIFAVINGKPVADGDTTNSPSGVRPTV